MKKSKSKTAYQSKLSIKQVEHVAKLARLGLTQKEKEKFSRELSSILGYIEKLKEVDTEGVELLDGGLKEVENIWRDDEAKIEKVETQNKLLDLAPMREKRFIKVKAIF